MANIPPSYEAATSTDVWDVITSSLDTKADYRILCLVSKSWHKRFIKSLWGNPWFKRDYDFADVYFSFITFLRCVKSAKATTRQVVHTITTPRSLQHAEFNVSRTWMLDLFSLLPNLKTLTIPGLPIFDAPSLSQLGASLKLDSGLSSSVRILNLSYCKNIVSKLFVSTLPYFKNLIYLDLSSSAVVHADLLKAIASFDLLPDLQILKLRNLGLADSHIKLLASGLGTRLWCLDVRGNSLTDGCVPILLDNSFSPPEYQDLDINEARRPSVSVKEDAEEWHAANCLAKWGTLWPDQSIKPSGLTQLYISGNKIGPSGCSALIQAQRLEYFDFGDLAVAKVPISQRFQSKGPIGSTNNLLELIKAQPYTVYNPFRKLRWLRIDHKIVSMAFGHQTLESQSSKDEAKNGFEIMKSFVENIYHLRAIVLTGIPTTTQDLLLVSSLKELITALAGAEASSSQSVASLSTGSPRNLSSNTVEPKTPHIPALLLELESERRNSTAQQDVYDSHDVSALSNALQKDFSFFDNEKEESASTARMSPSQSCAVSPQSTGTEHSIDARNFSAVPLDVVGELSMLRKLCKAKQDFARQHGEVVSPGSQGYWSGKISIIRDGRRWYEEPEREFWTTGVKTRWG